MRVEHLGIKFHQSCGAGVGTQKRYAAKGKVRGDISVEYSNVVGLLAARLGTANNNLPLRNHAPLTQTETRSGRVVDQDLIVLTLKHQQQQSMYAASTYGVFCACRVPVSRAPTEDETEQVFPTRVVMTYPLVQLATPATCTIDKAFPVTRSLHQRRAGRVNESRVLRSKELAVNNGKCRYA